MATTESSETGLGSERFDWKGNSTENFTVTYDELEEASDRREAWRENADIEGLEGDEWSVLKMKLDGDDARRNSDISGDENILHQHPEVVEEAVEKYPDAMFRQPGQGGDVVLSQGMSFIDAIEPVLERPLESIGGRWTEMVYATEGEDPDRVILSGSPVQGYDAVVDPAGDSGQREEAGHVTLEFSGGDYSKKHNMGMISLADQAVGRGYGSPGDVRNGELLLSNNLELNGDVDWDEVEAFEFELAEMQEEGPKVSLRYDVNVDYGGEVQEKALTYEETSMYAEEFEEMDSVQGVYSNDFMENYVETATDMSLIPLRAWTAALQTINSN